MDIEFFIISLILVVSYEFNMLLCVCIIRPDSIRMGHVGSYTLGLGLGLEFGLVHVARYSAKKLHYARRPRSPKKVILQNMQKIRIASNVECTLIHISKYAENMYSKQCRKYL